MSSSIHSELTVAFRRRLPSALQTKRLLRLFLTMNSDRREALLSLAEQYVRASSPSPLPPLRLVTPPSAVGE